MAEFDHTLADGTEENHAALAVSIAQFVDADTSEPQPPDDWDGWLSDVELRKFEKPIFDAHEWYRYADICRRAADMVDNPSGKALLVLSCLNGSRRGQDQDWELVRALDGEAGDIIQTLNHDMRQQRLLTLLHYHRSIYASYLGNYELAVAEQIETAEKAEAVGDYAGAAIARLREALDRYNGALSKGADTLHLIQPLHQAAFKVAATCTGGDVTQRTWRLYNAPIHVCQVHIWAVWKISPADEKYWLHLLIEVLPNVDPEKYQANLPTIVSIQAGLAFLKNQRVEALRLANEVETTLRSQARPEARTTARFVMAMLAADAHLNVIEQEGAYMHQLRAVARRILGGEVRPWSVAAKTA